MPEGRLYCALPNAFLCRKELAAGCTSNGNDLVGLASIKPKEDKTLRSGDMIVEAWKATEVRTICPVLNRQTHCGIGSRKVA
jgi:Protein of unknown function (DUF2865)